MAVATTPKIFRTDYPSSSWNSSPLHTKFEYPLHFLQVEREVSGHSCALRGLGLSFGCHGLPNFSFDWLWCFDGLFC